MKDRPVIIAARGSVVSRGKKTPRYPTRATAIAAFVHQMEIQYPQATRKPGEFAEALFGVSVRTARKVRYVPAEAAEHTCQEYGACGGEQPAEERDAAVRSQRSRQKKNPRTDHVTNDQGRTGPEADFFIWHEEL